MKIYKIILLFVFLHLGNVVYSQKKFQCNNITAYSLSQKYEELKHLGLERISNTDKYGRKVEIIPMVINQYIKTPGSKQLCIDTWYKNQEGWSDYKYNRYCKNFKYISKEEYIKNYDYLEMFYELVDLVMSMRNQ